MRVLLAALIFAATPVYSADYLDQAKVLREGAEVLEQQMERVREVGREERRNQQRDSYRYPYEYPSYPRCEAVLIDGKWREICR